MRKVIFVFVLAFLLNLIWENLHSFLYSNYRGGEITEFILVRASFWDAVMVSLMAIPFLYFSFLKKREWLIIVTGLIIATLIELYALGTNRWAYNNLMPIIPILGIGLSPFLQLGVISYFVLKAEQSSKIIRLILNDRLK